MDRILIVNVNWLGDVLFSTPLIRAIREKFPAAYIACMIPPRCKEILESNPRLNEIIIYDEEGEHRGLAGKLKIISYLRSKRFDAAFLLHRSFTRALIIFLAGIPRRAGYRAKNRAFLLTDKIDMPSQESHRVDFFLNVGRPCGVNASDRAYEFFISEQDRARMKKLLYEKGIRDPDFAIVLNPGGNWKPKRWAPANFAALGDELMKQPGIKVIITGARRDTDLAREISSMMNSRPVILCGETTLKELAAVFERANVVVANDSGPMHIAVSVLAKTVALFGPTSPEITGPIGKGKYIILQKDTGCDIPCYDLGCCDYKCMAAIKVGDVLEAIQRIK